ncbi:hypothetical protein J2T55_002396 [Methylohalomonas lacus]|uniref:ATP-grasp domain-containing protein n=1 Tax=Methylohalomonas lacus TaxID=398773 RepID=A0AAE3L213_9GAMM|nr:hypothetical protein [Methylohalomonas lacus]MCS3904360.1 hypothetical protein [Methylohalomonas lacus]
MICYFVSEPHQHTVRNYLADRGQSLAAHFTIIAYERVFAHRNLPAAGTYIFSDIERLTPARLDVARQLYRLIRQQYPSARILNHPDKSACRYTLLTELHDKQQNRFRVRRANMDCSDLRFPVFIRLENDHKGSRTRLLHDGRELRQAIAALRRRSLPARQLLVTEFCDTADAAGLYRKYAAFVVAGRIIPRHLIFGHEWMLKNPAFSDDERAREQLAFIRSNPHEETLQGICADARIDYGRIDYSLLDDRIQVWEINTNPVIMQHSQTYSARNLAAHNLFSESIRAAFEALPGMAPESVPCPLDFSQQLRRRVFFERCCEYAGNRWMRLMYRLLGRSALEM